MSYTALYRKLRPKTFNNVVGQTHIVKTLLNQINADKVSHAYLFCGTRGTGKTSVAKIFARTVNCPNRKDGEPCNICDSCLSILENRSMNVIEIDAASNNGVDNIRDIKEEVKYPPTEGIYKVYIIDEVHMLSTGAFNALLKTLEEPPSHVIFVLATTDPQKIPATIHSRCQRFEFKRISIEDMVSSIKEYMMDENIKIDDEAIRYIAQVSDGAMRDALSILDQSITFYQDEEIKIDNILNVIGSVDSTVFFSLTDSLLNYDSLKCMEMIEELTANGRDIGQFISELIMHFRNLLVACAVGNISTKALDLSPENINRLMQQGKNIESSIIINYIDVFSDLQNRLRFDKKAKILLEMTCIRLCNPQSTNDTENLKLRIIKLEKAIENGKITAQPKYENSQALQEQSKLKPKILKKAVPEDIKKVQSLWLPFVSGFDFDLLTKNLLEMSIPGYLDGDVLHIVANDTGSSDLLKVKEDIVKQQLSKKFSKDFIVNFISKKEYTKRHKELFGVKDENVTEINEDMFKDKINMDITFQ